MIKFLTIFLISFVAFAGELHFNSVDLKIKKGLKVGECLDKKCLVKIRSVGANGYSLAHKKDIALVDLTKQSLKIPTFNQNSIEFIKQVLKVDKNWNNLLKDIPYHSTVIINHQKALRPMNLDRYKKLKSSKIKVISKKIKNWEVLYLK